MSEGSGDLQGSGEIEAASEGSGNLQRSGELQKEELEVIEEPIKLEGSGELDEAIRMKYFGSSEADEKLTTPEESAVSGGEIDEVINMIKVYFVSGDVIEEIVL